MNNNDSLPFIGLSFDRLSKQCKRAGWILSKAEQQVKMEYARKRMPRPRWTLTSMADASLVHHMGQLYEVKTFIEDQKDLERFVDEGGLDIE